MTSHNTDEAIVQAQARFKNQLAALTAHIHQRALDEPLQKWLNAEWGPQSPQFQDLQQACEDGVRQGWLCQREAGGLRYGRIFKPSEDLHGFSVDVVDMTDVAGPHHIHPHGEIDLIMPMTADAVFDAHPAGWLVYPAGSAHSPTVSQGRALVLYLLPQGAIEFTR